jgi:hypothetical protein
MNFFPVAEAARVPLHYPLPETALNDLEFH